MTALHYTTDELIETVRQRGFFPDVDALGSRDADIIRMMNECMKTRLVPGVMKVHEEYLVKTERKVITAGTSRYRIPSRASGMKIRDMNWIDATGNRQPCPRLPREDLARYNNVDKGTVLGCYLEGSYVVLVPDIEPTYTGYIEWSYVMRPGDLVLEADARQITAIDTTTFQITVGSNYPGSWLPAGPFDIHSQESGADLKVWGFTATDIENNVMTLADATALTGAGYGTMPVEVGDWICLAQEAAIPSLPVELHVPLAQAAVMTLLTPIDPEAAQAARQDLQEMLSLAGYLVDFRVESSPQKIVRRNQLYGQ